ncbi:hypothetical protein L596_027753 [Steinernema carpocapsae]|uniref:Uncharacterized protein n=1 Tax=Steinernema carpocapsae TaxID=34508 RepID=A0A4U5LWG2_STECR|nr:hypothetical protein L596_027753 [Steinernema carpocapsae]
MVTSSPLRAPLLTAPPNRFPSRISFSTTPKVSTSPRISRPRRASRNSATWRGSRTPKAELSSMLLRRIRRSSSHPPTTENIFKSGANTFQMQSTSPRSLQQCCGKIKSTSR